MRVMVVQQNSCQNSCSKPKQSDQLCSVVLPCQQDIYIIDSSLQFHPRCETVILRCAVNPGSERILAVALHQFIYEQLSSHSRHYLFILQSYLKFGLSQNSYSANTPLNRNCIMEGPPLELSRLKEMIRNGIQSIPPDSESESAVLVIGDTGVGKSTILSFLSGAKLTVRLDGLKPRLDNREGGLIKIGHEKYSETSVPTKISLDNMAFYDCPGFKDNKGEEYEISNSFFIQRLLDIYKHVKLVLIVDESHISETRADKFPKLIKGLHRAFGSFDDIKNGVMLIVNRADRQHPYENYVRQLEKMIEMKGERHPLFEKEEREFVKHLIASGNMFLFRSPGKEEKDRVYEPPEAERGLLKKIKALNYVKSKHIQNILSESAKLAIRDFIDQITSRSNFKIEILCTEIVNGYAAKILSAGRDLQKILLLKEEVIKLAQEIKDAKAENILIILQREVPPQKMQDFEEDFSSVMFFKGIYDKTFAYFSNLINKIYSELTHLLTKFDKRITTIQREEQEIIEKQRQQQKYQQQKEQREREKQVVNTHVKRMDQIRMEARNLSMSNSELREELLRTLDYLKRVKGEFEVVKQDFTSLENFDKQLKEKFVTIERTYFVETQKSTARRAY